MRPGRLTLVRAAVVVALCATATPASAAPARPVLTGYVTVTAARTGSMLVTLPRAVSFDAFDDVKLVAFPGRMTAFALKKVGDWRQPFVEMVTTGDCPDPGCHPLFPGSGYGWIWAPGSDGTVGTLPAGTYRLYVVTDGAPVTYGLTFHGLPGRSTLRPRDPARAAVVTATPTVAEPAGSPSLFAAGSAREQDDGGLMATSAVKWLPNKSANARGHCLYEGAPPAGSALPPYQTPCDGGLTGVAGTWGVDSGPTPVGPGRYITGTFKPYLLPPGEWAIGAYLNTPGPVLEAYVHQLWLDF